MSEQWFAIYNNDTGQLISVGTVLGDVPDGHAAVMLPDRPDDFEMWDEPSRAFVQRPPKVLVDRLQDLINDPRYADFQAAWASLGPAQKAALRNGLIRLLGKLRWRPTSAPVDLDPEP